MKPFRTIADLSAWALGLAAFAVVVSAILTAVGVVSSADRSGIAALAPFVFHALVILVTLAFRNGARIESSPLFDVVAMIPTPTDGSRPK